jgi:hypothetical protein
MARKTPGTPKMTVQKGNWEKLAIVLTGVVLIDIEKYRSSVFLVWRYLFQ